MRKLILSIMLVTCAVLQAQPASNEHDAIDTLLHQAQEEGMHHEIIQPLEIAWYLALARTVGGAVFMKCLVMHNYLKKIITFDAQ